MSNHKEIVKITTTLAERGSTFNQDLGAFTGAQIDLLKIPGSIPDQTFYIAVFPARRGFSCKHTALIMETAAPGVDKIEAFAKGIADDLELQERAIREKEARFDRHSPWYSPYYTYKNGNEELFANHWNSPTFGHTFQEFHKLGAKGEWQGVLGPLAPYGNDIVRLLAMRRMTEDDRRALASGAALKPSKTLLVDFKNHRIVQNPEFKFGLEISVGRERTVIVSSDYQRFQVRFTGTGEIPWVMENLDIPNPSDEALSTVIAWKTTVKARQPAMQPEIVRQWMTSEDWQNLASRYEDLALYLITPGSLYWGRVVAGHLLGLRYWLKEKMGYHPQKPETNFLGGASTSMLPMFPKIEPRMLNDPLIAPALESAIK